MPKSRLALVYLLLVGLPILVLWGVLTLGRTLPPPTLDGTSPEHQIASHPNAPLDLSRLVIQIAVILLVSRVIGLLFKKIHQPQVVGEMAAGILLGPSVLGWLSPSLSSAIFPADSLGYLNALCQVGLVLFMFLVGVSLDPHELSGNGRAAVLTSHASIAVPFCLGGALALVIYGELATARVSFNSFALFIATAMSITAFPVLARILIERNLLRTRLGALSIACAAVDDLTGWCILAYIVVLIRSADVGTPAWITLVGAAAYVLFMWFGVRRWLTHFEIHFRKGGLTESAISLMIILALGSALATEWLGIHLVFGAFLMGAIMPKSRDFVESLNHRMESITVVVLLPLFFAFSGLRTNFQVVKGNLWLYTLLVIAVAIIGKFGGSMVAARMAGVEWRESVALGILMNTRGLMGLIALNIGLDIGVISPTVFTIFVLMALLTTFITSPLLQLVFPRKLVAAASRPEPALTNSSA